MIADRRDHSFHIQGVRAEKQEVRVGVYIGNAQLLGEKAGNQRRQLFLVGDIAWRGLSFQLAVHRTGPEVIEGASEMHIVVMERYRSPTFCRIAGMVPFR